MKYDETIDNKVSARKDGKNYNFSEHMKAIVYSLLSAQRPWAKVVKHLDEIDSIFFGYDAERILEQPDTFFVEHIRAIKCGNRSINDQMKYLPDNVATLPLILFSIILIFYRKGSLHNKLQKDIYNVLIQLSANNPF